MPSSFYAFIITWPSGDEIEAAVSVLSRSHSHIGKDNQVIEKINRNGEQCPKSSVKRVYMYRSRSNSMSDPQREISNECVEKYVRRKESLQFVCVS